MKVIAVSHGSYSKGLVESTQMLVGEQEDLVAYGLFPEQTVSNFNGKTKAEIDQTGDGEEILFVSDLFHGSPFNAIVSLMEHHDIYHVTGINLPLMVEVMMGRYAGKNAAEICAGLIEAAPGTVKDVRKLFEEVDEE